MPILPQPRSGRLSRPACWLGLALVAAGLLAYLPALRGGFVWDDDTTLTRNPLILAADGLRRIWFTTDAQDYWPVTYSALWCEWRLWGAAPFGYHAVNLALHLAEGVMLWAVLREIWSDQGGAWLAAALFVLHPVNVESVAWITQQKSLWAMFFYLASLLCFLRTRWAGGSGSPPGLYGLSLLAFVLAMLSKGSVAMLPFVLLGVIRWRRPLNGGDGIRLAPFLAAAGVLVAMNLWFRGHGSAEVIREASGLERLLGAAGVVWFYLGKALWPAPLIFVYPAWRVSPANPLWWLPLLGVLAVTGWLWSVRRSRARALLFGWGYFCLMLFPVMGFADVYFMKYSLVADHYQHLAIVGVMVLAAAGWRALAARMPSFLFRAGPIAVLAALGILTWRQCLAYHDVQTLYRDTLEKNPGSTLAHNNMGGALMDEKRYAEAEAQYEEVLRIDPASTAAHFNLAEALLREGRLPEAIGEYQTAVRLKPSYLEAHNDLGGALAHLGRWPEAISQFRISLALMPGNAQIHFNLANALADSGQFPAAIAEYREALRLKPDYAPAHRNLGRSLQQVGRTAEAAAEFAAAARRGGAR